MKTLAISSLVPREIVQELGEKWKTEKKESGIEFELQIPSEFGRGRLSAMYVQECFGFIQWDVVFNEDVEVVAPVTKDQPVHFVYCEEGYINLIADDQSAPIKLQKFYNIILKGNEKHSMRALFPAEVKVRISSVVIKEEDLKRRFTNTKDASPVFPDILSASTADGKSFSYNGMYSVKMMNLLQGIKDCRLDGPARNVYLEGLLLEVLGNQLALFEEDQQEKSMAFKFQKHEMESFQDATKIFEEKLEQNPSIPQVAREVGVNVNKLQEGFKHLYGCTVNQYVNGIRLRKSAELLHYSAHNVSEIVTLVGLSSKSYFSKVFKRAYGIRPSEYRKIKRSC